MPYYKLVIATECRLRPWPQPLELSGVLTLRTLDDAVMLRDAAYECRHVTIVGAGFLGLRGRVDVPPPGLDVSLIDVAPRPTPALGPDVGGRAARMHAAHGIDLRMRVTVTGIDGVERVECVRLSDGGRIETDLVLVALGALPGGARAGARQGRGAFV